MTFTPFQEHLQKAVQRLVNMTTFRAITVCTAYKKVAGQILGTDLLPFMKPTYRGGVLTVKTKKSALLAELRLHRETILRGLKEELGKGAPRAFRLISH